MDNEYFSIVKLYAIVITKLGSEEVVVYVTVSCFVNYIGFNDDNLLIIGWLLQFSISFVDMIRGGAV
jgi:hypothetical protein